MEFLTSAFGQLIAFLSYIVPFLGLLTVIVFIHELGHFLVGRYFKVGIETFSIGFGKEITGWYDRYGTRWRLAWLPLGGYVKFEGDANAASMPDIDEIEAAKDNPRSFHGKPLYQRAAIVAAGPIANFILAIFIYTMMFSIAGVPVSAPVIDVVKQDSAAEQAGLKAGDRIVEIDGSKINSFTQIQRLVSTRPGEEFTIVIKRNEELIPLKITPRLVEVDDGSGGKMKIGLLGIQRNISGDLVFEKKTPGEAVSLAVKETWFVISQSLGYVKNMIIGKQSTDQLAGPIRIAQVTGQVAAVSLAALVQLGAVLSISIGLINLFPIPILDGGHLLYYAIEAVRGKPLGKNAQEMGFKMGFALVITLMLVATWNDLSRLNLF